MESIRRRVPWQKAVTVLRALVEIFAQAHELLPKQDFLLLEAPLQYARLGPCHFRGSSILCRGEIIRALHGGREPCTLLLQLRQPMQSIKRLGLSLGVSQVHLDLDPQRLVRRLARCRGRQAVAQPRNRAQQHRDGDPPHNVARAARSMRRMQPFGEAAASPSAGSA